jgi:uncharacterized DUF497 family protein
MLTGRLNVNTFISVTITFDPAKRGTTLAHRGLDFADAARIFQGDHATWLDDRTNYGEVRQITAGWLDSRMIVFVWTQRGPNRHVISMRRCHAKEERKIRQRFGL